MTSRADLGARDRMAGLLISFAALLAPAGLAGQAATASVTTEPATVGVGDEFVLLVAVQAETTDQLSFPAVLALGDLLEQRGQVEIQPPDADGRRLALYRMVAWKAGEQTIPPFEIGVERSGADLVVSVPSVAITVITVLPADTDDLELRDARPFLKISGIPWWLWLLAALIVAALLYWWLRRRRERGEIAVPRTVAERALEALARLRTDWQGGGLRADAFFDRLESVFREYASATRGWSPGATLRTLPNGDRELAVALHRSALVRFGRLAESSDAPLLAIDAGEDWVEAERLAAERAAAPAEEVLERLEDRQAPVEPEEGVPSPESAAEQEGVVSTFEPVATETQDSGRAVERAEGTSSAAEPEDAAESPEAGEGDEPSPWAM